MFARSKRCVAYIETEDEQGDLGLATAFHVGNGSYVTARHCLENRQVRSVGFDDHSVINELGRAWRPGKSMNVRVSDGPFFHPDPSTDVACFRAEPSPTQYMVLGGHLDDWLGQYEFMLHKTLILGYPRIPLSDRPTLFAASGEINAVVDKYTGGHPYFLISTTARGGFSGAPVTVAYNERKGADGAAVLGMVTEALCVDETLPEAGYLAVLTVEPIYDCLLQADLLPDNQRLS